MTTARHPAGTCAAGTAPRRRRGLPPRPVRRGLAAVAATLVALLPAATSTALPVAADAAAVPSSTSLAAHLPADTEDVITWSVTPADEDGPDGRRWVDLEADPGATLTEHLAVTNFGDVPATFALTAADGYLTANGRFNMLPSDQESTAAGTWFTVQDEVEVDPDETVVVPYTIAVPANATPGDHPAGVAASIRSTSTGEGGTNLGVESRVGFRVTTRVTGEVQPVLVVDDVRASYTPSWNPFAAGDLRVSYDVVNEGNVRLGADGTVEASGLFGLLSRDADAEPLTEVLPGGSLASTVDVDQVWPLGPVTTTVTLTPVPVADDEIEAALDPVTVSVTTWAIPWPQLLLAAIVVVIVLGVRDERRRRRKRLDAMLARARDEGRRSAGGDDAPSGTSVSTGTGGPGA
ncbi:DUF916 domain-containing protein [Cellulosimicrobium marinum]|uniref:DUF916 domain-containing protein n=1 Tax=Cellulosimicrobium marinum TaxID=1638992 RepID=UPI001E330EC9|nr:DUF916 domain-containing protein [Cellulosimicrobium marinum]MCB7136441.1 DUF916 domain-containing protein [Cellulosimicrobium marinum]